MLLNAYIGRDKAAIETTFPNPVLPTNVAKGSLNAKITSHNNNETDTMENLFKELIERHNSMVDEYKQFKVGNVTVTYEDSSAFGTEIKSQYENTLSFISDLNQF